MSITESLPFIKKNLRKTVLALIAFFFVMIILGIYFEPLVEGIAIHVYQKLGLVGLSALVFFNDVMVSPLPGDVSLIIISKTELAQHWRWVVLLFGILSVMAGFVGHYLGGALRETKIAQRIFNKKLLEMEENFKKYGKLLLILGAITPLPYSLTVWTAGILRYPRKDLLIPALLRIPRFYILYVILIKADFISKIFQIIGHK
jgi:membrane protein YqaA with SNARE-associated domain